MLVSDATAAPEVTSLPLVYRGKVRDLYAVDDQHLLMVASNRLSAFDVILPTPIPGKGAVLTAVSNFWFERTRRIVPNHLQIAKKTLEQALPDPVERDHVAGRAVVARWLQGLPVEAIVRGYLIGSGWKDYQQSGMVCGIHLPHGLRLADRLPEPIFTPSTKAALGEHDENVDFNHVVTRIGEDLAEQMREISLRLYREAADYALAQGIIIADTKFEFGLDEDGRLVLMDEALTPDSSRFWPADHYQPGINPPSFDKQFVRDYLETLDWDKQPPGPELPPEIVQKTVAKYREALKRLTG
ncbi:MAG TPA: phosphoribosylaminoimidazolesuccinocarboxamide synthase [Candidatus Competibacteraceae bacterium]|nr:phosphoribosylaminoimidazolesuccinocarboxamide synthase [Candidatus Competibacteraceae bacterium]HPF59507.1 phosphoribosylaminoimidazolesuccinocarboxamide synthase [Candidatus Competibacteraceae bacterium]HRY19275.1 phosphoribosylaminoimidazolesuccinocarboxamide synthase [Candidatus Competibacteraceae bacterium]